MLNFNSHETEVTIQVTTVKLINEVNDEVFTMQVNGKLTTTDAKAYAKEVGYTFVSKENSKQTFVVNTNDLKQLQANPVEPSEDNYDSLDEYQNAMKIYHDSL